MSSLGSVWEDLCSICFGVLPSTSRRPSGHTITLVNVKVLRLIEETMEIDELPENDERLLKKPEIKRDEMGRFEQAGTGLIKKRPTIKKPDIIKNPKGHGGLRAGAGRPRGSKNKISLALKEMILTALDEAGGVDYLKRLAIENSSAFASLLGRVLPTTLQASESDGGAPTTLTSPVHPWCWPSIRPQHTPHSQTCRVQALERRLHGEGF
jgi:hypothetical protein